MKIKAKYKAGDASPQVISCNGAEIHLYSGLCRHILQGRSGVELRKGVIDLGNLKVTCYVIFDSNTREVLEIIHDKG